MSRLTLFRLKNQMFFFILEYVLQKMAPYFFPNGGLYVTPKTLRVRIRTRLAALIFA